MSTVTVFQSPRLAIVLALTGALAVAGCGNISGPSDPKPGEPCGPVGDIVVADGGAEGASSDPSDTAADTAASGVDTDTDLNDTGLPNFPHALAIDPDTPTRAWFTFERGLLASEDGGVSWGLMETSKIDTGLMVVTLRPPGGELLVAGPGVFRASADEGETWRDLADPTGADDGDVEGEPVAREGQDVLGVMGGPNIRGLTVDPADPNSLHMLLGDGSVWNSTDAGATWRNVGSNAPDSAYGLWPVASEPMVIWTISIPGRHVCRSEDGGAHWSHVEPDGLVGQLQGVSLSADGVAYAATIGGLFRSEDGGQHWEKRGPFKALISAATSKGNSDTVLVIAPGGSIFRSDDGGLSWGDDGPEGSQNPDDEQPTTESDE